MPTQSERETERDLELLGALVAVLTWGGFVASVVLIATAVIVENRWLLLPVAAYSLLCTLAFVAAAIQAVKRN